MNYQIQINKSLENFEIFAKTIKEQIQFSDWGKVLNERTMDFLSTTQLNLKHFTSAPQRFYWFSLLENLINIAELHLEYQETYNREDRDEILQDIEEIWMLSEFESFYNEHTESDSSIMNTSNQLLRLLEQQLLSSYYLWFGVVYESNEELLTYMLTNENGDGNNLLICKRPYFCKIENLADQNILNLNCIDYENKILSIEGNQKSIEFSSLRPIGSHASHSTYFSGTESQHDSVAKALELIRSKNINIYEFTIAFISNIFIIKSGESFSSQSFPGNIFINDSDLMDTNILSEMLVEMAASVYFFTTAQSTEFILKEHPTENIFEYLRSLTASTLVLEYSGNTSSNRIKEQKSKLIERYRQFNKNGFFTKDCLNFFENLRF